MSVSLTPSSALTFNRPLTQLVKRVLTISNTNDRPVAFKVKTTAPKLYCVRPNSGRIEPGEQTEVAVMLQPMKDEPPLNFKCKDKFLIQSIAITPEKEQLPLADLWSVPDGGSEDARVHQQKLRVTYLPPEGQVLEEVDESSQSNMLNPSSILNGADNHNYMTAHKPADSRRYDPIPEFSTDDATTVAPPSPQKEELPTNANVYHAPPAPVEPIRREPSPKKEYTPVHTPEEQRAEPPKDRHMEAKLESAHAEIERLRALLASVPSSPAPTPSMSIGTGLTSATSMTAARRRHRGLADEGSTVVGSDIATTIMDDGHTEGVPLQAVVVIAVGVFVMTYLFF
ncbi:PapD-like protein [Pterulicium gracile]|uniref:PapD-like protein n=1 Tax=Pterulicium gracile TaxID=1884261 RepID=A0A5C3QHS3_9AGAR|nr:PapD-like protein [Pterula gracilis]